MDYVAYLQSFNSFGDRAELLEHYTPDARIEGANGVTPLEEFVEQLYDARDGVQVSAIPLTVLGDEDALMAELDITYTASRDRPDHPVVPLQAGETVTMRFFSVYELDDGKIARFSRSYWRVS